MSSVLYKVTSVYFLWKPAKFIADEAYPVLFDGSSKFWKAGERGNRRYRGENVFRGERFLARTTGVKH